MAKQPAAGLEHLAAVYAERVHDQDLAHPGYASAWEAFSSNVLQHGGVHVVPPLQPDPLIGLIDEEGGELSVASVVMRTGERSDCHANAVALWRAGEVIALGTGYALSDD